MKYLYSITVFLCFLLYTTVAWTTVGQDAGTGFGKFSRGSLVTGEPGRGRLPALPGLYGDRSPRALPLPVRVAVDARLSGAGVRENTGAGEKGKSGQIFDVTSARKLNIHFLGYKELTGIYSVNADATVSIPVLGRISVAKMDTAELERILSKKVMLHTGRKGYATVEVMSYRPVFVTGAVKKPKSYDWVPGMTVLHVIALAGGTGIGNMAGMNVPLSRNSENSRVQQANSSLKHILAVLARLRAEKVQKNHITVPQELVRLAGRAEARRLISVQHNIYRDTNKYYKSRLAIIRQARGAAKKELKAMKLHGNLLKRQIRLHRRHSAMLKKLKRRKLVGNTVLLELETKTVEAEAKNIKAMIARAKLQGKLLKLQRELMEMTHKRRTVINNRIFKLEEEASREKIILGTARKAIQTLNDGSGRSGSGRKKRGDSYQIMRESREGFRKLAASHLTRLQPGDIVVINR